MRGSCNIMFIVVCEWPVCCWLFLKTPHWGCFSVFLETHVMLSFHSLERVLVLGLALALS